MKSRDLDRKFTPDFARARGRVLGGIAPLPPTSPPILCGERTRKGTPCKAKALRGKMRCKFHGGASTGPKTQAGRDRIAETQRNLWAKWRAENGQTE